MFNEETHSLLCERAVRRRYEELRQREKAEAKRERQERIENFFLWIKGNQLRIAMCAALVECFFVAILLATPTEAFV